MLTPATKVGCHDVVDGATIELATTKGFIAAGFLSSRGVWCRKLGVLCIFGMNDDVVVLVGNVVDDDDTDIAVAGPRCATSEAEAETKGNPAVGGTEEVGGPNAAADDAAVGSTSVDDVAVVVVDPATKG